MTLPFAATSLSEHSYDSAALPLLQRAEGASRLSFRLRSGAPAVFRLYQSGSAKIRLPRPLSGQPREAILINTAGGLTGGDRMAAEVEVGAGCRAVVTSQACEKIYRARSGVAEVAARLTIGDGARLDWLPQETILFDGGRLSRRLEADLAPGATLLAIEATIFGRTAHGETVRTGDFRDRWRIRRQGRLIFADDLHFDWAIAHLLDRPALLGGGRAMATILLVCDEPERHLESMRTLVGDAGGVSAWDGKLLARIVAEGGAALRRVLIPGLVELLDGAALPTIWRM